MCVDGWVAVDEPTNHTPALNYDLLPLLVLELTTVHCPATPSHLLALQLSQDTQILPAQRAASQAGAMGGKKRKLEKIFARNV